MLHITDCFSCFTFTVLYLHYCTDCICAAALLVRIKIHIVTRGPRTLRIVRDFHDPQVVNGT